MEVPQADRMKRSSRQPCNERVARFYDRFGWLYPLVDLFCAPARRRLIAHVNRLPAGQLLEIGVGPGDHLGLYRGHRVTAIDCSAEMVSRSRLHAPDTSVFQMDGEDLEFPDASFDYVALCHVLTVTADPSRMLAEVYRVLRPGGRLFILNHETPDHAWRHVDRVMIPLSKLLRFRSWFHLKAIPGVERFRRTPLAIGGGFGLMTAYSLEK